MANMFKKLIIIIFLAVIAVIFYFGFKFYSGIKPLIFPPPKINSELGFLKLADGFEVSVFAKNLGGPRVMTFDPDGNLLTSITSQGKVVALPDKNVDAMFDETITVAEGLNRPHGLAFLCQGAADEQKCWLYIAETDNISRYDYDHTLMKAVNKVKIVDLPGGGQHFTRTLVFGPDGRLYVSIGSSCNVCLEDDPRRAKIFSMKPDGTDFKEFARGLRNAVFFTWHPVTGKMWATEMGRDFLGDNLPPDEINVIEQGKNYGWPICYGKNVHDADFDKNVYFRNPCMEPFETQSFADIPAHSAPLGLAFEKFGEGYDLLVAYHGSWNRTEPTGYKIVRYKLDEKGNYLGQEDFITGWLKEGDGAYGRPVDILIQPDGVIYVSDDKAGVIYKVHRVL